MSTKQDLGGMMRDAHILLECRFDGNQRSLARELDVSRATVNRTLNPNSSYKSSTRRRHLARIISEIGEPTAQERAKYETLEQKGLANATPAEVERTGDGIRIPTVAFKASAGDGTYALEEETLDTYVIDKDELPPGIPKNGIFRIEVEGNSMMPDLTPGEFVLVQRTPAGSTIRTDSIYLIRLEELIMLKALQRLPGRKLRIISRNETYENYTITLDGGVDFEVIGRVWGRFERLG